MASLTYAGATIAVANAIPATFDEAGYVALSFDAGECALHSVPALARTYASVDDPLVCRATNSKVKGSASWDDVTFPLSRRPSDSAQLIYRALEIDRTGVGSFRIVLPGDGGTFYFTAQVGKFALFDGGGQDDRIAATVMLFIQSQDVLEVLPIAA